MRPLHLLGNVQAGVQDELVEVLDLVGEARLAVAALLRGAELVLEEGVVLVADDGKVVAHGVIVRIGRGFEEGELGVVSSGAGELLALVGWRSLSLWCFAGAA